MFNAKSRYYTLEEATFERPGESVGESPAVTQRIAYKRRRFLPQGKDLPLLAEVSISQGERLDLLTHRLLGDSEQYWQVCDANNAMNPAALLDSFDLQPSGQLATQGVFNQIVRVPLPQA